MGDKYDISPFGPTGLGFHLTINPQKKPKPTRKLNGAADLPDDDADVAEIYKNHGLRLGDKELRALRLSRPQGVEAIDTLLSHTPGFSTLKPNQRLGFAMKAADLLLEKSIEATLSREVPTALDENEQAAERLNTIVQNLNGPGLKKGPPPSLLDQLPVGLSLTVHFASDW